MSSAEISTTHSPCLVHLVDQSIFIESFPQMYLEGNWLQNRSRANKMSRDHLAVGIQRHQRGGFCIVPDQSIAKLHAYIDINLKNMLERCSIMQPQLITTLTNQFSFYRRIAPGPVAMSLLLSVTRRLLLRRCIIFTCCRLCAELCALAANF